MFLFVDIVSLAMIKLKTQTNYSKSSPWRAVGVGCSVCGVNDVLPKRHPFMEVLRNLDWLQQDNIL